MSNYSMSNLEGPARSRSAVADIATLLARVSLAGPAIFIVAWVVLGLLRPGYSAVTQPISGLGVGPGAPAMNAAFVAIGLLQIAGTIGSFLLVREISAVARWSGILLLGASGGGAVLCGLFTWESFAPHMLGSSLGLVGPVFGLLVAGVAFRRSRTWRRLGAGLLAGAALTFMLGVVFFTTFSIDAVTNNRGVSGLIERVLATEIQAWYVVLALAALRSRREAHEGSATEVLGTRLDGTARAHDA